MQVQALPTMLRPQIKCTPPPLGDHHHGHTGHDHVHLSARPELPLGPSPVGISDNLRHEVVELTQRLVQVNSGPDNLVPGENQVVQIMADYAQQAGLEVERFETRNGKPMLIVTLPGTDPQAGSVGFVHHSDVVQPEGEWKLGEPFSGKRTHDEAGREVLVGRGTIDTKGPAAQILVAMKHLKQTGQPLERSLKLFMFPDEEFGGKDGAWYLARTRPELFRDVQDWVVEGSGVFSPEFLNGLVGDREVPYLAMAQKYTIPMQLELKQPARPEEAIHKTQAALERLDDYIEERDWSFLGDAQETRKAMGRMGDAVGGIKGFLIKHFHNWDFMKKRMGTGNAAANRTDFCKTDFYLSSNPNGSGQGPNVKPSSATALLQIGLDGKERTQALDLLRKAAGEELKVEERPDGRVALSLPQENYHGGNHGSTADRQRDAVDVVGRALQDAEKRLARKGWDDEVEVLDFWTSKSQSPGAPSSPVTSTVTLDLRVAVDDQPQAILADLARVAGPDFQLKPLMGPEEAGANVRRLRSDSPLFQAAERSIATVYGAGTPVLFGNTTASNDMRFLMDINPQSQCLTFVPVLYTNHGAHGPDEAVTVRSLQQGVDWVVDLAHQLQP